MIKKILIFNILFIYSQLIFAIESECKFCLFGTDQILNRAENFLEKSPKDQISYLEKKGYRVLILNTGRKNSGKFFQWGSVRIDPGKLTDISKIEGALGKTLCKNERPIASKQFTIVISADAPMSTLLHEYLHTEQILKDPSWCELSKNLWENKNPTTKEIETVRNHEWDVRKILWSLKENKAFNLEDQIVIADGIINESKQRANFDPNALKFINEENVEVYLKKKILNYTNKNGN